MIAALLLAAMTTGAAAQELRTCRIAQMTGEGRLVGAAGERRAAPGMDLESDDAIITSASGRIEVVCSDGIVVTVGVATHIELSSLIVERPSAAAVVLRLLEGIAGFLVPMKTFTDFSVETQSAVAAVRSTAWLVEADQGTTDVFVREGSVRVAPRAAAAVTLEPGEGLDVDADGQAAPVRQWGQQRVDAAGQRIGFGWR